MARGSSGESVLHKHLRILEVFDTWHPYLTLSEIARVAGLAPSSAHRLVGELEREGLLERLPDLTYRLGVRLWEFASRTPGAIGLREVARPAMSAVHQRVRQHTQLGVRSGVDVLFVERLSTPGAVVNATLIGGRVPLYASSCGLVLLAHAPEGVRRSVVAGGMRTFTPHTIDDPARLRRTLQGALADGFVVTEGHIHLESRGIAVPVRGPDGSVYAALGVVVANDGSAVQPVVELLTIAAARISRALAHAYSADGGQAERAAPGVSERSWAYIDALHAAGGDDL